MSSSISPDNYKLMQDFIVNFTSSLDYNRYRIAAAFFATSAGVQIDLTQCRSAGCVRSQVESMTQSVSELV